MYDTSLLLFEAVALLAVWSIRAFLIKYKNVNIDDVNISPYFRWIRMKLRRLYFKIKYSSKRNLMIDKQTGTNSLIMLNSGANKATVMATLRQITGIDYNTAKSIVDSTPARFMVNVSSKEAEMTKKALEFVGAEVEVE